MNYTEKELIEMGRQFAEIKEKVADKMEELGEMPLSFTTGGKFHQTQRNAINYAFKELLFDLLKPFFDYDDDLKKTGLYNLDGSIGIELLSSTVKINYIPLTVMVKIPTTEMDFETDAYFYIKKLEEKAKKEAEKKAKTAKRLQEQKERKEKEKELRKQKEQEQAQQKNEQ